MLRRTILSQISHHWMHRFNSDVLSGRHVYDAHMRYRRQLYIRIASPVQQEVKVSVQAIASHDADTAATDPAPAAATASDDVKIPNMTLAPVQLAQGYRFGDICMTTARRQTTRIVKKKPLQQIPISASPNVTSQAISTCWKIIEAIFNS